MSYYPLTDGPKFVASIMTSASRGGSIVYKDFFQADEKSEVVRMAKEVCLKEKQATIVFERGNTIIERFKPEAIDDIPQPEKAKPPKKIKRK